MTDYPPPKHAIDGWKIGIKETWFTLARRVRDPFCGSSWTCQKCGYSPGSSDLPHRKCINCGEQLQVTADNPECQEVVVETTSYGYKLIWIGAPPNVIYTTSIVV